MDCEGTVRKKWNHRGMLWLVVGVGAAAVCSTAEQKHYLRHLSLVVTDERVLALNLEENENQRLLSEVLQLVKEMAAHQEEEEAEQKVSLRDEEKQLRAQLDVLKKELEAEKSRKDTIEKSEVQTLKQELETIQAAWKAVEESKNEETLARTQEVPKKPSKMYWPSSLVFDKTLEWDPTVYRPWLDADLDPKLQPPAMILLTNYGWNQPNQEAALQQERSIREQDLYTGVINHPWFHPTLWQDLQEGKKNISDIPRDTQYYVFTDIHQCGESNWPIYGGGKKTNGDDKYGRKNENGHGRRDVKKTMKEGKLFVSSREYNIRATAIQFDCQGFGVPSLGHGNNRVNGTMANWPLSIVSVSSLITNSDERYDQGLIAPAGKPATLSKQQEVDIQTCTAETKRSLYVTYAGNFRSGRNGFGARNKYKDLNDNKRLFIARYFNGPEFNASKLSEYSYVEFLMDTVFALAPRGDNKFSYRFTEALSAGAIPVVHADDWVWPFRPELVDWKQCAVILPEKDAGPKTIAYLDAISVEERCRMRQACRTIYKHYVETPVKQIDGIVKGLVWRDQKGWETMKLQGIRCDAFEDPTECNLNRRRRRQ